MKTELKRCDICFRSELGPLLDKKRKDLLPMSYMDGILICEDCLKNSTWRKK